MVLAQHYLESLGYKGDISSQGYWQFGKSSQKLDSSQKSKVKSQKSKDNGKNESKSQIITDKGQQLDSSQKSKAKSQKLNNNRQELDNKQENKSNGKSIEEEYPKPLEDYHTTNSIDNNTQQFPNSPISQSIHESSVAKKDKNGVIFPRFQQNDGGYINADDSGYQILMNWYHPPQCLPIISLTDLSSLSPLSPPLCT